MEPNSFIYIFHSTSDHENTISQFLTSSEIKNYKITSNENEKCNFLKKSILAIAKSGTISLEIANYGIPFITIYKMNFLNFLIINLFHFFLKLYSLMFFSILYLY